MAAIRTDELITDRRHSKTRFYSLTLVVLVIRPESSRLYPWGKQCYGTTGTMLAERERAGKTTSWKTPEDVMKWWLRDREKTDKSIEGQMEIDYGQL